MDVQNYTVGDIAQRWRCSRAKVYRLMSSGDLGYFQVGDRRLVPASIIKDIESRSTAKKVDQL